MYNTTNILNIDSVSNILLLFFNVLVYYSLPIQLLTKIKLSFQPD